MTQESKNKIKELNNGKVVRIFKNKMFYKIASMETMAAIVITPEVEDDHYLLENLTCTGHCTITEAEMLIEHLLG